MKVLVIGSGGREHAIVWKVKKSRWVNKVYCAPGNGGISSLAVCVPIQADDIDNLLKFAQENEIDLTIVGPEGPLSEGIVDRFEERGLRIFGPTKAAARLESSKSYAKMIMERYNIPTAKYVTFKSPEEARKYIIETGGPLVVKVDGLASGKGAFPCEDELEALEAVNLIASGAFKEAGSKVLIEEYLVGEEASVLAFSDGKNVIPLESAQDHKRALDDDKGLNTGGMGAYSPAPVVTEDLASRIYDEILVPTIKGMKAEGHPYKGILYAGLMITEEGPKVIEYNCRFGDPEIQAVIPRLATDIIKPILACCDGSLDKVKLRWSRNSSVCVVMASGGYPGKYTRGHPITGLEKVEKMDNTIVFHAGTRIDEEGRTVTSGGRVLGITALGPNIKETIRSAYKGVKKVEFKDAFYRTDIGKKALFHIDGM
ncbi:MAG: phosphoribosylamine--glycine ligase [Candidatus Thermoplasmatota archaeon]|nr:phosphoribosylamine--glycine ligase [Candidatus Thermoplasmatota archaeon]